MVFPISPEWIEKATRDYIAGQMESHPEIAKAVAVINALPLYVDWAGGVAIRTDGELIGFLWDGPESAKPENDPGLRFIALVIGVERYPELESLRPHRSNADRDCPVCKGTGEVDGLREHGIDPKVVRCYCGGAGWLPANVDDPPNFKR